MSDYPVIKISAAVEVQPPITTDTFHVLSVAENPDEKWVNVFVSGAAQNVWVNVLNSENYFPNWTDEDVEIAVNNWALSTFPLAK